MKAVVYTQRGTKTKRSIELSDRIFNASIKNDLLAQAIYVYNSNQRQGTQKTKSRSEVSGGGRKPWRQKTPDRARHGSIRSPIWIGGGHTHAIRPRNWRLKMPKKMRQGALFSILSHKLSEGKLKIVDKIEFKDKELTKQMLKFYDKFGGGRKLLIVTKERIKNVVLGAKSLNEVKVMLITNISVYDILVHDQLVILEDAVEKMNEIWAKKDQKVKDSMDKKKSVEKKVVEKKEKKVRRKTTVKKEK